MLFLWKETSTVGNHDLRTNNLKTFLNGYHRQEWFIEIQLDSAWLLSTYYKQFKTFKYKLSLQW